MKNTIKNKKKFLEDYFNPFYLKKEIIEKYGFSNYDSLNKWVVNNNIQIELKCKVCGDIVLIKNKTEYTDLENGTVCENHLNFSYCKDCKKVWINNTTQNLCLNCSKNYIQESRNQKELWLERSSLIWNNIKYRLDKETVEILEFIFKGKNLTTSKLDEFILNQIKENQADFYYEGYENEIFNFLLDNELIFKYNNKYLILKQIEEIIKSNKSESLYKQVNRSENRIYQLLKNQFPELRLIREHSPEWLNKQRFDFYSEKYKIAIEWHGQQHYTPVSKFGGEIAFELNQIRDEQKRVLCHRNNVKLIELKYDLKDAEIIEILKQELKYKNKN